MKNQIKLILAIAIVAFSSCEKGSDGTDGKNGSTIISGPGNPKTIEGVEGDFYMDTINRVLWGPKKGNSWGNGIEMNTNTILNGTSDPTADKGKDGDFYLNSNSKMLFGPKTNGSWGLGNSLIINGYTSPVIYTPWKTSASVAADTTIDGTFMKVKHLYPSSLSQDILDNGLIMTFFRIPGETTNYMLPYTSNAGGKANTLKAYLGVKRVVIGRYTHDNSASIGMSSSLQFKNIFIPGNLAGSVAPLDEKTQNGEKNYVVQLPGMDAPVDLKALSYEEVCKLLHINSNL